MPKVIKASGDKPKIGLALGSGAARGLTHIGALKAIEEHGISIDYISGCSIGALIGGAYAKGMSASEIEDFALQTNWKLMAKVFSPTFSLSSLINDSYIVEILNSIIGKTTFEELAIPFSAITTDIQSGKMVVLEKGDLLKAVRASISIPILLSPVTYGKHKLVDGGLVNPTPVDVLKKKKMDKIIAVNLRHFSSYGMYPSKLPEPSKENINTKELSLNEKLQYFIKHPIDYVSNNSSNKTPDPKIWDMIYQMLIIIQVQVGDLSLQINKPDILIEPDTGNFKSFDFNKAKELIEIGYISAMEQFERYKQDNIVLFPKL